MTTTEALGAARKLVLSLSEWRADDPMVRCPRLVAAPSMCEADIAAEIDNVTEAIRRERADLADRFARAEQEADNLINEARSKLEASFAARDLATVARDDWKSQAETFKRQRDEARAQVSEMIEKQRQVAAAADKPKGETHG